MNKLLPLLGSTIVLLALLSHSLTAQILGLDLSVPTGSCSTDVYSPVPDASTRDGWREYAKFLPGGTVADGEYGHAVSIHGNYAVVGAPDYRINNVQSGAAFVYYRSQSGWNLQGVIAPSDGDRGDGFGKSVDIKGSTIVVGAPWEEAHQSNSNAGSVYVFQRTGSSWSQTNKLTPGQRTKSDEFGFSLDLTDAGLWVGALTKETGDKTAGSVYYFAKSGGVWTEGVHLLAREPHLGGSFGYDLKANDDNTMLIIGAPTEDAGGKTQSGTVYVHEKNAAGVWYQSASLYLAAGAAYDHFGYSVSLEDNTLVVGAPGSSPDATTGGKAFIIDRSTAGNWFLRQTFTGSATTAGRFGHSVSISGDSLLIGSPNQSATQALGGIAHLYVRNGSTWTLSDAILPLQTEAGGRFGSSVALDHGYLFVGGPGHDGSVPEAGAVFFFEENYLLSDAQLYRCSTPVSAATPLATDNCAGTVMGSSVETTTFSDGGSYYRVWNFSDGNGNFSSAVQTINVARADLSLPYLESAEAASVERHCWSAGDLASQGIWGATENVLQSLLGSGAFALEGKLLSGHSSLLNTPTFNLEQDKEYYISFHHRTLLGLGTEGMRLTLVNDATGAEVKQLFQDPAVSTASNQAHLIFTVPATADYRLSFDGWGGPAAPGLILDEILIQEHTAANGWPGLAGNNSDDCFSGTAKGLDGFARSRFLNPEGQLMIEIDPNGNDMGDVTVSMTDYNGIPVAPFARNAQVLGRYFDIVPENGSGPYVANGGVKVRLYFAPQELADLNQLRGTSSGWGDIQIFHYSGENQDCDISNSNGSEYQLESLAATAEFGLEGRYIEFYTNSFSEFSATTEEAATSAALPVKLADFTAAADHSGNRLDWWVESESGFSHYEVQRSADGHDYREFATVTGRNLAHYTVTDGTPYTDSYYRLRMVDHDGSVAYSQVVYVAGTEGATGATAPEAYPVPTKDVTNVRLEVAQAGSVHFRLVSLSGRTIRNFERAVTRGVHVESVDLSDLPAGTYLLNVRTQRAVHNLTLSRN